MTTCAGCGVQVTQRLRCPTCIDLGEEKNSLFCSQHCLKNNWVVHKFVHKALKRKRGLSQKVSEALKFGNGPNERISESWMHDDLLRSFAGFEFTGPLRPYPRKAIRSCTTATIDAPDYHLTGDPVSERLEKKNSKIPTWRDANQIEAIREACRIGRKALDLAHSLVMPGVSSELIDDAVHDYIVSQNAYPSPLNYNGFPKSCCTSVNEVICHGIPDKRPLENGDLINVDITVYYKGMHGDLNETFVCGDCSAEDKILIETAYRALWDSIKLCRPGVLYREIGNLISKVAASQKLSVVRTYCGHGIGSLFHCAPTIPHYKNNKAIGVMKPGHIFTIEPMLNLGTHRDVLWPDNWSAVTADGKRSAQFEHTLLITTEGAEVLTQRLASSKPLCFE